MIEKQIRSFARTRSPLNMNRHAQNDCHPQAWFLWTISITLKTGPGALTRRWRPTGHSFHSISGKKRILCVPDYTFALPLPPSHKKMGRHSLLKPILLTRWDKPYNCAMEAQTLTNYPTGLAVPYPRGGWWLSGASFIQFTPGFQAHWEGLGSQPFEIQVITIFGELSWKECPSRFLMWWEKLHDSQNHATCPIDTLRTWDIQWAKLKLDWLNWTVSAKSKDSNNI